MGMDAGTYTKTVIVWQKQTELKNPRRIYCAGSSETAARGKTASIFILRHQKARMKLKKLAKRNVYEHTFLTQQMKKVTEDLENIKLHKKEEKKIRETQK